MIELDYPNYLNYGFQEVGNVSMMSRIDIYNLYIWYSIGIVVIICVCLYMAFFSSNIVYININMVYHNIIEIIYTILPCVILVLIFIPSIELVYVIDNIGYISTYMNIVGYQWYWVYSILEYSNIDIDITTYNISDNYIQLENYIELDNYVYIPIYSKIKVLISGGDIIHSFGVISIGLKIDAIPGRVNSSWLYIVKKGMYVGYCSELCGTYHNNMNILLYINSFKYYIVWLTLLY